MSTQVTIIILACIIAFCYLVTMVYNYKWNKEKEKLSKSIEKLYGKIDNAENRLSRQIETTGSLIAGSLKEYIRKKEVEQ